VRKQRLNKVDSMKSYLCKRLDLCWPQWVHFGSREHHRTSWNLMESHRTSWNPMEPHGISRNLMESRGTSWNPTEPHGTLRNLMESHGILQNLAEPHGNLWKVLEHGGIFWLLTNDYQWWHHPMYLEHSRSQQPVYKGSLPFHSDSSSLNSPCSTFVF
jgi:hypothetical protein